MMMTYILPVLAFVAVVGLIPVLRYLAVHAGMVDEPGGRKRHDCAIPPVGGLAVFPVFVAVTALAMPFSPALGWFYAALLLLVVTGALDDRYSLPARIRFPIQFMAAFLIVVPGGAQAETLGNLLGFGDFMLGHGAIPFSIIATVLLINAVNLMDGVDGLSGGMGLHIMVWLAVCVSVAGYPDFMPVILIMAAALAGFLVYNMRYPGRRQACVFMGDAGSLALGLTLAWFAFSLSQPAQPVISPIAVAWLLALPIYDTCAQFARRVSLGRHPFDADHHHFHHHFLYAGFTPGQTTAFILAIAFAGALFGVLGWAWGLPEWVLAYVWIGGLFAHMYMSMRPTRYRRLLLRLRGRRKDEGGVDPVAGPGA